MNLRGKTMEIGLEDLEESTVKYSITVTASGDFKRRLWLIKNITRIYIAVVKILSRGVCVGDLVI